MQPLWRHPKVPSQPPHKQQGGPSPSVCTGAPPGRGASRPPASHIPAPIGCAGLDGWGQFPWEPAQKCSRLVKLQMSPWGRGGGSGGEEHGHGMGMGHGASLRRVGDRDEDGERDGAPERRDGGGDRAGTAPRGEPLRSAPGWQSESNREMAAGRGRMGVGPHRHVPVRASGGGRGKHRRGHTGGSGAGRGGKGGGTPRTTAGGGGRTWDPRRGMGAAVGPGLRRVGRCGRRRLSAGAGPG